MSCLKCREFHLNNHGHVDDRLIRARELCQIIGLSRPTLWRMEKAGNFPKCRRITAGTVGWLESEVNHWINTRPEVDI